MAVDPYVKQAWPHLSLATEVKMEHLETQFDKAVEYVNQVGVKDAKFEYVHDTASETWTITHNLGKYPAVAVVNSAKDVVYGDVTYLTENSLQIVFIGPFAGRAYLN